MGGRDSSYGGGRSGGYGGGRDRGNDRGNRGGWGPANPSMNGGVPSLMNNGGMHKGGRGGGRGGSHVKSQVQMVNKQPQSAVNGAAGNKLQNAQQQQMAYNYYNQWMPAPAGNAAAAPPLPPTGAAAPPPPPTGF